MSIFIASLLQPTSVIKLERTNYNVSFGIDAQKLKRPKIVGDCHLNSAPGDW